MRVAKTWEEGTARTGRVCSSRNDAMTPASQHIREVESVVLGRRSVRDHSVAASWQRCVEHHGLDPTRACEAHIVTESRLREHREAAERLIRTARSGLETLHRQMSGQGYVLLLADAKGVTVDYIGDPTFDNHLRKAGLYLGSDWAEERAGTCGVGSCIATGEALTIHQSDHFDITHTPLTCTAAPIYDIDGCIAAVLDISALRSPELKSSQNLVFHMVGAVARRIELANLMSRSQGEWVLRLSRSPEFLDVDPDAAVSLDGSGRITGATHVGRSFLAEGLGSHWRDVGSVIGRSISDFLEIEIDDLPSLMRGTPREERLVTGRSGGAVFAHAIAPQLPSKGRRRHALASPLAALTDADPAMLSMLETADRLAKVALPVFLKGETGTGKERLARAIHAASRRQGPFVAINCAALPESLIEGELFGYAAGAFTGASARGRKGLIEEASGGTLFLDEIGDLPYALQGRLLRVLSEGEVMPVGSTRPKPLDLRVLSATNRDLLDMVDAQSFRADLYYRIAGAVLTLPPLREREDFDWLVACLLAEGARDAPRLGAGARLALIRHDWPGNIRELKNALAVASALSNGREIAAGDLPELTQARGARPVAKRLPQGKFGFGTPSTSAASGGRGAHDLAELLEGCGWNVSQAARRIGVDRTTVHRRMQRAGLVPPNRRSH